MPRLSIIVTAYNIEDYIGQCLYSVCEQTLDDIEIIVVDDGSSDATPTVIGDFASRDSRIRPVLLRENSVGGVATAANAGLDIATADYIGFFDGDDYCEPAMLAKLLAAAEQHDSDLAMCDYAVVDCSSGEESRPADAARWNELDRDVYALDVAERKRFLRFVAVPWRKIYRRSMLERRAIRFPVGDYFYEDNPFHWFAKVAHLRAVPVLPGRRLDEHATRRYPPQGCSHERHAHSRAPRQFRLVGHPASP